MKAWVNYRNGNYNVCLNLINGTKIRQNSLDYFLPHTIESCDIKITNQCRGTNCAFCLPQGAKLHGIENDLDIKEAFIGAKVTSCDIPNNINQPKQIENTYARFYEGELIKIESESGNTLLCTPTHKVFTINRGFVEAQFLTENDILKEIT